MIPVYRDEISPNPAERVHTLQLHAEIRLCPGKDFHQFKDTLKSETIFGNWKPIKNDEKYFLFHLKSSFGSQDI